MGYTTLMSGLSGYESTDEVVAWILSKSKQDIKTLAKSFKIDARWKRERIAEALASIYTETAPQLRPHLFDTVEATLLANGYSHPPPYQSPSIFAPRSPASTIYSVPSPYRSPQEQVEELERTFSHKIASLQKKKKQREEEHEASFQARWAEQEVSQEMFM